MRPLLSRITLLLTAGVVLSQSQPCLFAQADSAGAPWGSADYGYAPRISEALRPSWLSALEARPRLTLSTIYDDNVFVTPSNKKADLISAVSPGLGIVLGDYAAKRETYISLDYFPTFLEFLKNSDLDTVEQHLGFSGLYQRAKLSLAVSGVYSETTEPDEHINERVSRTATDIRSTLRYELSKIDFGFEGHYRDDSYDLWPSSGEVSGGIFSDVAFSERWRAGIGIRGGEATVENRPDQTFEQALLRLELYGAAKTTLVSTVGIEHRDYGANLGSATTWVANISGEYRPFDGTLITLSGHRRMDPSPRSEGLNVMETGVSLSIQQRFLHRFGAGITASFEDLEYTDAADIPGNKNEIYTVIKPSVSCFLGRYGSATLYFQTRRATAAVGFPGYTEKQAGLEINIRF